MNVVSASGIVKVTSAESPDSTVSELKPASSLEKVWGLLPSFVKLTVTSSPAGALISSGLKELSCALNSIEVPPPVSPESSDCSESPDAESPPSSSSPPHAARKIAAKANIASNLNQLLVRSVTCGLLVERYARITCRFESQ